MRAATSKEAVVGDYVSSASSSSDGNSSKKSNPTRSNNNTLSPNSSLRVSFKGVNESPLMHQHDHNNTTMNGTSNPPSAAADALHHSPIHPPNTNLQSLEELLDQDDRAERGLLQSMEQRRSTTQTGVGDIWQAAVPGERPPLGASVPMLPMMTALTYNNNAVNGSVDNTNYANKEQSYHHRNISELSNNTGGGTGMGTGSFRNASELSVHTGGHSSHHSHSASASINSRSLNSQSSAGKLADIARRMRLKSLQNTHHVPPTTSVTTIDNPQHGISSVNTSLSSHATSGGHHRRAPSRVHALLDSIQETGDETNDAVFDGVGMSTTSTTINATEETPASEIEHAATMTDRLMTGAMQVEELFDDSPSSSSSPVVDVDPPETIVEEEQQEKVVIVQDDHEIMTSDESIPLISTASGSYQHPHYHGEKSLASSSLRSRHSDDPSPSIMPPPPPASPKPNSEPPTLRRKTIVKKKKTPWWQKLFQCCLNPLKQLSQLWHWLWYQTIIISGAMPCFILAILIYYQMTNPHWNFLPGNSSVAWWLNFVGRQILLWELARIVQWIVIDNLVLGTKMAVQCLGPLLTLCLIQARGWPFCVAAWGLLDLMLVEGGSDFERHWLFFTKIQLYSGDGGIYILTSDIYMRLLFCMILAGICTAVKRTAVAMYFGRRTFVEFKPRLEKLLKEVVLVSELAALAIEAELAAEEELLEVSAKGDKVKLLGDVTWSNRPKKKKSKPSSAPSSTNEKDVNKNYNTEAVDENQNKNDSNKAAGASGKPPLHRRPVPAVEDGTDSDDDDDDDDEEEDDEDDEEDDASDITTQQDIRPEADAERLGLRKNRSGHLRIKYLLEDWQEPVNKADKSINASISDMLRFRRALTFMDDDQPFGETFGFAKSRDQLIKSAHTVYQRLLHLTPGRKRVSCEFYDMLALEDDGQTVNIGKRKALRRLFRPDANNELSLLTFVQSCDSLYKKLRYFRANVGNASVIDHALESIVDGAFSFILALILLSIMRVNPWPLLVSISTLLVSISFAVGSSASKWFEGMLLVACRRPFDLGDRIYMTDPSLIISDGLWYCWFIEDINLFHTTVRYAGTNEVATINNGSVANMRIINGARSKNAYVWFQFAYRANLMENGNIDKIKVALEEYAREHCSSWHSFGYFRVDEVHPHIEKLVVTIGMMHHSSWQDLVTILESKAAIMCWLMEYSRKLGVLYDELPRREVMYYGGALKDGGVQRHRYELHNPANIASMSGFPVNSPSLNPSHKQADEAPQSTAALNESLDTKFLEQLQHSQAAASNRM